MKKGLVVFLVGLIVILAAGVVVYYFEFYNPVPSVNQNQNQNIPTATITNFNECAAAGYPIAESYPRQCSANGQTFTEDIGNAAAKQDLIILDSPEPNTVITSPLQISGKARGNWYFEAVFPVKLYDANGNILAEGQGQAQSDWTTNDFVQFKTTLEFTAPATDTGTLVLEKDNPSGLPQNADSLTVPVKFR